MSSRLTRSLTSILTAAALAAVLAPQASAQILLRDDFDDMSGPTGAQGDGIVDTSIYRAPFGDGAFLGQTQLRFDLPTEGVSTLASGSTDGEVAVIELDTYNPFDPGAAFFGTDLITKSNYARAGGLRWEGRMRFRDGIPGGIVGAGFLYDVTRQDPPGSGTLVRDEIDHELLSNDIQGSTPHSTFTNVWNDGPFTGPTSGGSGATIDTSSVSGTFDLTEFHTYRIDWLPSRVDYYIDDTIVRTETAVVPDDPMSSHFNLWVPDSNFTNAYDPSLVPTASEGSNVNYAMEVDYVQIERLNTDTTELLVDGSFEDTFEIASVSGNGPAPTFNEATETGEWVGFNNAYASTTGGDSSSDGFNSVLMYGPFKNTFDASGIWQNVDASEGQEFRGSVMVRSPSNDSIFNDPDTGLYDGDAKVRFLELSLAFLDENGDAIKEVPADANSVNANGKTTALLDSRNENQNPLQDEWIEFTVDAIAPEGTELIRYQINFVQDGNFGTGAVFFDEASLLLLEESLTGLAGDYNNDGMVDAADYTVWRDADGTMTELSNDPIGGTVGAAQYTQWADNYGQVASSTSATIPEPTAVMLLALGALSRGVRRRA